MTSTALPGDNLDGNFTGCATGAYVNGLENLASFESLSGKKLAVVSIYIHWPNAFPSSEVDQIYANGSIPLLTWEPWIANQSGTLESIAAGSYESYVRDFMQAAKNWQKPLLLRFAHEMNGNWYPWDGFHNGAAAGPAAYKRAWQYIYNVRADLQATNIKLVWCVNNTNVPSDSWNNIAAYFPGDGYVDWLGIDGYNWGYDDWQSFHQAFSAGYAQLTALSNKPLMVGEFAAAEQGGDKAAWITAALADLENSFPRVKLFCWFNINKERDWRIDSSASAAAAYRDALQKAYFSDKI